MLTYLLLALTMALVFTGFVCGNRFYLDEVLDEESELTLVTLEAVVIGLLATIVVAAIRAY